MTIWLHSTILATCVAATIAVGIASAAKYEAADGVAPKADMLTHPCGHCRGADVRPDVGRVGRRPFFD